MESCSIILLCLILFIMMSSSFICIATYYKISFLLKANIPLVCIPHFLNPYTVGGHLHCFCVLAVVNSAAVRMDVQRSLHDPECNTDV